MSAKLEQYLYALLSRRAFLKGTALAGLGFMAAGLPAGREAAWSAGDAVVPASMELTAEERAMLEGKEGPTLQKVMQTIVLYGEAFGATRLVLLEGPVHLVAGCGLFMFKPLFRIADELIAAGLQTWEKFTADPRPIDYDNINCTLAQKAVFNILFSKQHAYEAQLQRLGLRDSNAFTCTCYLPEVGNIPARGAVVAWAESSAVVYANSVLGSRTNRNSGIIELLSGVLGKTPCFGLLTDEGRKATWLIELATTTLPDAQVLGSAMGMKVMEAVPYIRGLDRFIGTALTDAARDYLKDMGAAAASNGAVGLYHVEHLTPEAVDAGTGLLAENYSTYVIDDAAIAATIAGYPVMWPKPEARPQQCFIGCPHLSVSQLHNWTTDLGAALAAAGRQSVAVPTVLTAAPDVIAAFKKNTAALAALTATGARLSSICPLLYMHNPLCAAKPVITNSNKLRTYTTARYLTDAALLTTLVTGAISNV